MLDTPMLSGLSNLPHWLHRSGIINRCISFEIANCVLHLADLSNWRKTANDFAAAFPREANVLIDTSSARASEREVISVTISYGYLPGN